MTTPATEEQIANFSAITGSNIEQAKFFLESSNNDADAAVSAFFDSGGTIGGGGTEEDQDFDGLDDDEEDDDMGSSVPATVPSTAAIPAAVPSSMGGGGGRTLGGGGSSAGAYPVASPRTAAPTPSISANWGNSSGSNSSSRSATPSNPFRSNQGPRVSTLRDLNAASSSSGPVSRGPPADDEEDDDQLEFFTGGEKSGLSVENPNARKKKSGSSDAIKDILARAQAGGEASAAAAAANVQGRSVFSGAAHTLGSDDAPSTFIPDPIRAARAAKNQMPGTFQSMDDEEEEEVEDEIAIRNMHFFSDGFSIDDGDLLPYDVPANQELLEALRTGRAPLSVLKIRQNQRVELRIAERRQEKWSRQAPARQGPFEGSGNRLGDAASSNITSSRAPVASRTAAPATTGAQSISPSEVFEIDAAAPVTSLQIRLRDGSRLVARFNHSHTVGDIRRYINAANPGQSSTNYALMTTFPSKDLEDDTQTIKEANLLGSVIVQRGL